MVTRPSSLQTLNCGIANSVVSMENAKYMCLGIKNFYLTATFEYYEYMRIPLSYFPEWTIKQYKLLHHVYNGYMYIKM